jgi:3alpha(or 20beta)-hydroxysteroid dehydrogenase
MSWLWTAAGAPVRRVEALRRRPTSEERRRELKRFEGRLIVITGGAGGLGAEDARQLAAEGARVIVTDRSRQAGEELAASLGQGSIFFPHDVTSDEDWAALAKIVTAEGGLHGLVNNAGVFDPRLIADTDTALFRRHMEINQLGCFLGMKYAADMIAPQGASIVNISSLAGLRGPRGIAYVGTKWAVRGMTKTAALELAPRKIRVNSVHPAFIDTPMLEAMSREAFAERMRSIPLGRAGTADDVAKLVLFLLSDDSSFITGAEIAIDGGLSI